MADEPLQCKHPKASTRLMIKKKYRDMDMKPICSHIHTQLFLLLCLSNFSEYFFKKKEKYNVVRTLERKWLMTCEKYIYLKRKMWKISSYQLISNVCGSVISAKKINKKSKNKVNQTTWNECNGDRLQRSSVEQLTQVTNITLNKPHL